MKYYEIGFYGEDFKNSVCSIRGYENAKREAEKVEQEYGVKPTIRTISELEASTTEPMGGYWEF